MVEYMFNGGQLEMLIIMTEKSIAFGAKTTAQWGNSFHKKS